MKALLLLFLLSTFFPLQALYNGNPSFPNMPEQGLFSPQEQAWGIKLGFEGDGIFEKQVMIKPKKECKRDRFDAFQARRNVGVVTLNIIDRFEIYSSFGAFSCDLLFRPTSTLKFEYESESDFIWSVGARIILIYWAKVVMGVDVKYAAANLSFHKVLLNGAPFSCDKGGLDYREAQVGVSFSREIGMFNPYLGLAYAEQWSCFHGVPYPTSSETLENQQPFILFFGAGFTSGEYLNLNIESRLIGEKGLTVSADLRF